MECKICGGRLAFMAAFPGSWEPRPIESARCGKCGLMQVINCPSPEDRAKGYADMDRDEWFDSAKECVDAAASSAVSLVGRLLPDLGPNPSLLDVGCGDGHLLDQLRKAYPQMQLAGTELPGCCEAGRKLGFTIYDCGLDCIPQKFDIVTIVDVVEHVPDVNLMLRQMADLVNDGGYLLVHTVRQGFTDAIFRRLVRVPVLGKVARKWFSTRLSWDHVQLFTDRSLKMSLYLGGLEVVEVAHESKFGAPMEVYLAKMHCSKALVPIASALARAYCRLGLLQNKIVCLARKRAGEASV